MTDSNELDGFNHDEVFEDSEASPQTIHLLNSSTDQLPIKDTLIKERVWVVVQCTLIASLSSLVAGMATSFSSPALLELSNENLTIPTQQLQRTSILFSVFGVSDSTIRLQWLIDVHELSEGLGRV